MANASPKGTTLMMICAIAEERPMCELKANVAVQRPEGKARRAAPEGPLWNSLLENTAIPLSRGGGSTNRLRRPAP